jgi:hypothetical protein
MTTEKSNKKLIVSSALIVGVIALVIALRGCISDSGKPHAVASATDPRPDPSKPFPNMNAAGFFVNADGHTRPLLQIPAGADQATVQRLVSEFVRRLITIETLQLSNAANIEQYVSGAIAASIASYDAAASGSNSTSANQNAMVSAAQYLCEQGLTGPLICPLSLGFDQSIQSSTPRVR